MQSFRKKGRERESRIGKRLKLPQVERGEVETELGYVNYDMSVQSVFTTFRPTCFREGFVSDERIDVQSNNAYQNGFCIHSNDYVSVNSNNTFETGTVVSMPDMEDIHLPRSGWESNEGLQAALRQGYYRLRIINKLPFIIGASIAECTSTPTLCLICFLPLSNIALVINLGLHLPAFLHFHFCKQVEKALRN